jgi:hypothetical protein
MPSAAPPAAGHAAKKFTLTEVPDDAVEDGTVVVTFVRKLEEVLGRPRRMLVIKLHRKAAHGRVDLEGRRR